MESLIRTLWDGGTLTALGDADLLERFLRRDTTAEAAFAALIDRHGPLVIRVCREVTGESHSAQDAAQATFLILAQKAHFIRRRESLANWLFGTARRVAARACRDARRRRWHERRYAEAVANRSESGAGPAASAPEAGWAALYQELDGLPERYRAPIVLCDLEGQTHDQAAAALGCPRRTLQTRLYRGRERLRGRLVRRGLAPMAGLLGGSLAARAKGSDVPLTWVQSTARAAVRLTGTQAGSMGVPEAVSLLFEGVNKAMFQARLRWYATITALFGFTAILSLALPRPTPGAGLQHAKETKVDRPPSREEPAVETAPITVTGRAIDQDEKPISGATIYLVSTNGTDAPIATTTTDRAGRYTFREASLPVSVRGRDAPSTGTFQVYGTAPEYAFEWHGMREYDPQPRPRMAGMTRDFTVYRDDPIVMDLVFTPATAFAGRIVDESGRPVSGVRVRIDQCDYLDTEGLESHLNFREFRAIHGAPGSLRSTKSDRDGRFRLEGLPREAGFWLHFEHPEYAWLGLFAATTSRPTSAFDYPLGRISVEERPPVMTGELNLTLRSTRRIAVTSVFADTGRPAPKVRVTASQEGGGTSGYSADGTTDSDGNLKFRLPPGAYEVRADPTPGGADCIRTLAKFTVKAEPAEQSLAVRANPGCVVILEAVDAQTGRGVPDVAFLHGSGEEPVSWSLVQSRSGYIDDPRSDADGRIRAVIEPGSGEFSHMPVAGYPDHGPNSHRKRVSLPAGQTVTVKFELAR